jgi:hypothetical protein
MQSNELGNEGPLFQQQKKKWEQKEPQPSLDYKRHVIVKSNSNFTYGSKSKCTRIQVASISYTYNG